MSEATFITRKEYKNVVKHKYLHWLVVFLLCALQKGIAVIHVHEHF